MSVLAASAIVDATDPASAHDHPPGSDGTGTATADTGETGDSDADGFAPSGSLRVEGATEAVLGPDGTTVFVAAEDGFAIADVSDPADPELLAERRGLLDGSEGEPMSEIWDVAVEGDRLLVMGPAQGSNGPRAAILYDVGDPADPRRLAVHRTDYPIHNGTLRDGLAYLTANDGGANPLEIVEVDEGSRVLGSWSPLEEDPAWADVPDRLRPIHDVIVDRGVAYCSYWDAGTWLVDVSDPTAPRAIGHVGERSPEELADVDDPGRERTELPGNHHSAAVDESGTLLAVGKEAWDDGEAWDGHGGDERDGDGGPGEIDLVDVSSPESPAVLSTIEPPSIDYPSSGGYWTTAHNFELRGDHLYSAWFRGGVRVHDVSDPAAPREVAAWNDPETANFWTAQVGAGVVVGSSRGTDDVAAGLYTFPDPARAASQRTSSRLTGSPSSVEAGAGAALVGGVAWLLARKPDR